MRHLFLIIGLFVSTTIVFGQDQFNKEIDVFQNTPDLGLRLIKYDQSIFLRSTHICNNFSLECSAVSIISEDGIIEKSFITRWLDSNKGQMSIANDTIYWIGHSNDGNLTPNLLKMNIELDSLETYQYNDPRFNTSAVNTSILYGDKIILAGLTKDLQDSIQGVNFWINKDGTLDTIVDFNLDSTEVVFSTSDIDIKNDLLVLNYSVFRDFDRVKGFIKYNKEKEVVWRWEGPPNIYDNNIAHFAMADDLLVCSYQLRSTNSAPSLIAIAEDSTIVWEAPLDVEPGQRHIIFNVSTLENGDILTVGYFADLTVQNTVTGIAIRVDNQGNELWRRVYKVFNEDGSYKSARLFDAIELDDGSIMMTGAVLNPHPVEGMGDVVYDDLWLLRTDANGCLIEGCSDTTSVSELQYSKDVLFPNPAYDQIHMSVDILGATIYDLQGRKIQSIMNTKAYDPIDIHLLDSGIFILQYNTKEKFGVERFYKL